MKNMKIKEMTMNLVNDGLVSVPWQESQESNYAATRLLCVRATKSTGNARHNRWNFYEDLTSHILTGGNCCWFRAFLVKFEISVFLYNCGIYRSFGIFHPTFDE